MQNLTIVKTLKAALLAAVLAALCVSVFHTFVTEPVIDRAIAIEEQMSHAENGLAPGGHHEAPIVSREVQKWGLFLGWFLYAVSWAGLFGALYFLAQNWLPGASPWQRGLAMAALAYWGIALLPFLKYPANPPGVGDPATIDDRQTLYLTLLGLSVIGGAVALALYRQFAPKLSGAKSWLPALVFLGIFSVVMYIALPGSPDAITMPLDVVQNFRVLSLSGLTVFWAGFGLSFAWLAQRLAQDTTPALRKT
jgi:predicted cobalt transporter CbtA